MSTFDIASFSSLDCVELTQEEQIQTEGGLLPLVVYGVCWGAMLVMSAVAAGMGAAYDDTH
jgi:hypothetical protein